MGFGEGVEGAGNGIGTQQLNHYLMQVLVLIMGVVSLLLIMCGGIFEDGWLYTWSGGGE